jgi:archaellin
MEDVTINYLSNASVVTLTEGTSASGNAFAVTALKDDDNSEPIFNDRGDRFEIEIDPSSIEDGSGLGPGTEVRLEISTKTGDTTIVTFTTPDTYSGKEDGDPISL